MCVIGQVPCLQLFFFDSYSNLDPPLHLLKNCCAKTISFGEYFSILVVQKKEKKRKWCLFRPCCCSIRHCRTTTRQIPLLFHHPLCACVSPTLSPTSCSLPLTTWFILGGSCLNMLLLWKKNYHFLCCFPTANSVIESNLKLTLSSIRFEAPKRKIFQSCWV